MSENAKCEGLRETIRNHQNALQPVRTQIHIARNEVQSASRQVSDLENELQAAKNNAGISRTLGRLPGSVGGAVVGVLGTTETAFRISRLEGEIRNEKQLLERARTELSSLENELEFYQQSIKGTQSEMRREGCAG